MFREFSVRTALFGLVATATVMFVALEASSFMLSAQKNANMEEMEQLHGLNLSMSRLDTKLLQARRAEKDFLLRRDEKYVDRHATIMTDAAATLDQVKASIKTLDMQKNSADAEQAGALLANYGQSFEQLVAQNKALGLTPDAGLEGKLRGAVHELETLINGLDQHELKSDMLMLRRHEKDFLLRSDEKYLSRLQDRVATLKSKPADLFGGAVQKTKADAFLSSYQTAFEQLVETKLAELQTRKQLSAHYASFAPIYASLTEQVLTEAEARSNAAAQLARTATVTALVASGIVLSLFVIGATQVSRTVSGALRAYVNDLNALSKGTFQTSKITTRFTELRSLSNALRELTEKEKERNVMREKIAASHRAQTMWWTRCPMRWIVWRTEI